MRKFVFKNVFNMKKQKECSVKNFEKEERKDILVGLITIVIIVIIGVLIFK